MDYHLLLISIIIALLAIIVLSCKGDGLIAGYNIASKEEKEKVNSRRLRLVVGITMLAVSTLVVLFPCLGQAVFCLCFVPIILVCLILSNTWCKKT